jgi:hypothetical protein
MSRSLKITFSLGLVAAAVVLIFPAAAQGSTNVVPNPGFEQGGCGGNTPVLCGWEASGGSMSQDTTNPHSGTASMHLDCGVDGCYGDPFSGWASVQASTDAAFCAAIGPGVHSALFWYRDVVGDQVSLDATFYSNSDCTATAGYDSFGDSPSGEGWQQLGGALDAPPGTQSVLFSLSVGAYCDSCSLSANFDDVNVDDAVVTTPIVRSFSPTSGPVGTSVDIEGFNFTGATSVTFNGTPASFTVQSATSITASVPDGATTGPISVTTPTGTGTSSEAFTVILPPTIDSFTPTSGPVGTQVDILGQRFTGAIYVLFGDTPAMFTIVSDSEIHATVPCGGTTGPIWVLIPNGPNGHSSSSFTVIAQAPTINSFTPTTGPAGTSVWISGSNFCGASSVTFNGKAASFYLSSDSDAYATVPSGATTGPISVTTPKGTGTTSSSFTVTHVAPIIDSFAPTSGPFGKFVDIVGSHFTAASSVKFNGTAAAFTVNTDSEIYTTVPCGATTGPISVTTPDGSTTSSSSFTVAAPAPTISSFTPTSGPVGTSVDILGSNYCGATSVTINGTSATFTVDSNAEIHATVPTGATTGPVSITTPGGTGTGSSSFTVTPPPPPTISSFTPSSGPVGTSVDIQGTNFTGATSVTFNGAAANYTVNSSTDITAHVPAGATSGPISVTTSAGTGTSNDSFTVIPPPTIVSFTPTSGQVGTSVSITGTGFTGATSVTFNGAAANYMINSPTSITATVPNGATTGPISVTTPGGTGTSSTSFAVIAPPRISSFSPTSGHAGQQVTITGTNFTGTTSVKLGTVSAKFTVNSATKITATVPTIPHGNYRWSITNPAGTATSTGAFHVM